MSRSGYSDDFDDLGGLGLWRGAVASAIRGRRGQALLRELRAALDAMPTKELTVGAFKDDAGCLCTLGVLAQARGMDLSQFPSDPSDVNYKMVGREFGVAGALAAEIMYENDEGNWENESPAQRWQRMRNWVAVQIATTRAEELSA